MASASAQHAGVKYFIAVPHCHLITLGPPYRGDWGHFSPDTPGYQYIATGHYDV